MRFYVSRRAPWTPARLRPGRVLPDALPYRDVSLDDPIAVGGEALGDSLIHRAAARRITVAIDRQSTLVEALNATGLTSLSLDVPPPPGPADRPLLGLSARCSDRHILIIAGYRATGFGWRRFTLVAVPTNELGAYLEVRRTDQSPLSLLARDLLTGMPESGGTRHVVFCAPQRLTDAQARLGSLLGFESPLCYLFGGGNVIHFGIRRDGCFGEPTDPETGALSTDLEV